MGANWTTADEVAETIERAAARAWADNRDGGRAVRYHTAAGVIRAELRRDTQSHALRMIWHGQSRELCRAEAVALIRERMASAMG